MTGKSRAKRDEETPEADRRAGAPHPRQSREIIGHRDLQSRLAAAAREQHLHHGLILAGPPGVGKATLAYHFARHLLAEPGESRASGDSGSPLAIDPTSPTWRQVAALSHPRLLVIRRNWDSAKKRFPTAIGVDEVRRIRSLLTLSVPENRWRVVIVDSADELTLNASNALLKSLEEPPARCVFLLISARPQALLATIRSRCRILHLGRLCDADLAAALACCGVGTSETGEDARLLRLAEGSVGTALDLAEAGGLEIFDTITALLGRLPRLDTRQLHALADQLGGVGKQARFDLAYALLLDLLARLIRAAAANSAIPPALSEEERNLLNSLAMADRLAQWAELWETIARDKAALDEYNLDRRAFVLTTFFRIEALVAGGHEPERPILRD